MPIFEVEFTKRSSLFVEAKSLAEVEGALDGLSYRVERRIDDCADVDWEYDGAREARAKAGKPARPDFVVRGDDLVDYNDVEDDEEPPSGEDGGEPPPPIDTKTLPMFAPDGLTPLTADERERLAALEAKAEGAKE